MTRKTVDFTLDIQASPGTIDPALRLLAAVAGEALHEIERGGPDRIEAAEWLLVDFAPDLSGLLGLDGLSVIKTVSEMLSKES